MARGPAAALAIVDELESAAALPDSHLLPSVRGELLARLGRTDEARAELELAIRLCANDRENALLADKLAALDAGPPSPHAQPGSRASGAGRAVNASAEAAQPQAVADHEY
jgi:hypothetical protein